MHVVNGLQRAGVECELREGGWETLKGLERGLIFLKQVANNHRGIIYLIDGEFGVRWKIAALLLTDCLRLGKSTYISRLHDLVQSGFDEDKSVIDASRNVDMFWLRLDYMRKHAYNESAFADFISTRSASKRFLTVITAPSVIYPCLASTIDLRGYRWMRQEQSYASYQMIQKVAK